MEFILINKDKIKVMLTKEDFDRLEMDSKELDYADKDTKRIFADILSKAKEESGFDTEGKRILIQFYPSKKGGCEMFVTKIGEDLSSEKSSKKFFLNGQDIENEPEKFKKSDTAPKTNTYVFSFSNIKHIINVCKILKSKKYKGESKAFCDSLGNFFLLLQSDKKYIQSAGVAPYSFIFEFGKQEDSKYSSLFFEEYCQVICKENAVFVLSKF